MPNISIAHSPAIPIRGGGYYGNNINNRGLYEGYRWYELYANFGKSPSVADFWVGEWHYPWDSGWNQNFIKCSQPSGTYYSEVTYASRYQVNIKVGIPSGYRGQITCEPHIRVHDPADYTMLGDLVYQFYLSDSQ